MAALIDGPTTLARKTNEAKTTLVREGKKEKFALQKSCNFNRSSTWFLCLKLLGMLKLTQVGTPIF